jgi:cytochrome c oxidase subunit IV
LLAAWFAQIDLPSLDQSAPGGLRSLLNASFLLLPVGLLVGVVGHMIGVRAVVAIGIALVMLGSLIFVIAIASYG